MVKQQLGNNPSVKGRIWPKVRFLCIDAGCSDGERNGGKWGDLGKGGKRSEMMVRQGVITEKKATEWGRQLWRNGRL